VPPGSGSGVRSGQSRQYQHKDVLKNMRKAVEKNEEIQVELVNFKKNRERFVNLLSIIPVRWDGDKGYRYSVGFQVEVE
jgi:hypothetical protein